MCTNLPHDFVVLQHAPGDVDTVIVPIRPWHMLVDICVDSRHSAAGLEAQRKAGRGRVMCFRGNLESPTTTESQPCTK